MEGLKMLGEFEMEVFYWFFFDKKNQEEEQCPKNI